MAGCFPCPFCVGLMQHLGGERILLVADNARLDGVLICTVNY